MFKRLPDWAAQPERVKVVLQVFEFTRSEAKFSNDTTFTTVSGVKNNHRNEAKEEEQGSETAPTTSPHIEGSKGNVIYEAK